MERKGVEWSGNGGMEWDGMGWNGVEWHGVEWSRVEWNGVGCPGLAGGNGYGCRFPGMEAAAQGLREREVHRISEGMWIRAGV